MKDLNHYKEEVAKKYSVNLNTIYFTRAKLYDKILHEAANLYAAHEREEGIREGFDVAWREFCNTDELNHNSIQIYLKEKEEQK